MVTISILAFDDAPIVAAHVALGVGGEAWAGSIATPGVVRPSMTSRSRSIATVTAASSPLSRSLAPGYGLSTPSPAAWRQAELAVCCMLGRPRRTLRDRCRELWRPRARGNQACNATHRQGHARQ